MGILQRYITLDFLVSFLMTLGIFTFVMCSAAVFKIIDLMARGISGTVIFKVFLYNMPYILSFSIPMATLTTALLLFSRLSFDGEITAMRASGMSLWQIASPLLVVAILLSSLAVYLNMSVAPNSRFARRTALHELGAADPIALLDEGRFVTEFPGMKIYIGKKSKDRVEDIVVYETGPNGVKQNLRAQWGEVIDTGNTKELVIDLYDVRIERPDENNPMDPAAVRSITAEKYPVKMDLTEMLKKGNLRRGTKDLRFYELLDEIRNTSKHYPDHPIELVEKTRTDKLVAFNKRLVLSFSCFAFLLLAIPLGMKSQRRESSAGVGISLLIVLLFYAFIIVAESTVKYPGMHPEILIWVPVLVAQAAGFFLIRRIN